MRVHTWPHPASPIIPEVTCQLTSAIKHEFMQRDSGKLPSIALYGDGLGRTAATQFPYALAHPNRYGEQSSQSPDSLPPCPFRPGHHTYLPCAVAVCTSECSHRWRPAHHPGSSTPETMAGLPLKKRTSDVVVSALRIYMDVQFASTRTKDRRFGFVHFS